MKQKIRVMIVDDNIEYTKVLCKYINDDETIEIVGVSYDGMEALTMLTVAEPDVLILDMVMPNLDGIGVLERMRRVDVEKKPVIIVVSGMINDKLAESTIALGADYFMLKPVDFEVLADRIRMFGRKTDEKPVREFKAKPDRVSVVPQQPKDIESMVTDVLHEIGIPAHIKGYQFLRYAIMLAVDHLDVINSVTKELYPTVASNFKTTSSRVERAIRHAIEIAWDRGDTDVLNSIFGYTIANSKGKPTNLEFIAMIADKLRLQIKNIS